VAEIKQSKTKQSESKTTATFDIIISGGGLSGSLMALSLAKLSCANGRRLKIAIIEATAIKQDISFTFDDRVLALSHGSASYLHSLGAWPLIKANASAIKKIHISDRGYYGKARLTATDHGVTALGFVVEMSVIGKALYQCLAAYKQQITWFTPDSIDNIKWQKNFVKVSLTSGQQLNCSLLLGCDGAQSKCRKLAKIESNISDYQQSALIANVSCQHHHEGIAFERFTEHGPIAMLPMSSYGIKNRSAKGRCSLVWTLPPEQAVTMSALNDNDFKLALNENFGSWLGEIIDVGKRDVYPLKLVQAQTQIYHRMALVGNASHTIHPIAGQGFNLGVRDVKQLAQLISNEMQNNKNCDLGTWQLISQYQQQRAADLAQVIGLTDSLVTLFSNQLPPLVIGRNIGLKVVNYCTPLKNLLVQKTMGY
jgi:2-octaprenyl-6-methoxyphenol hydroxylase